MLEKAGVKPPKTWAELRTAAKKLTVGKQYGFAFNATADYEGAWQFLPPMWTNGGDETDLKSPAGGAAPCSCGRTSSTTARPPRASSTGSSPT